MTLKEYFKIVKKERVYDFYASLVKNPKVYDKISRNDIYKSIISLYDEDPELILRMSTLEEINVLRNLINEKKIKKSSSYIDYLIMNNLSDKFLVIFDKEYFIPQDILNYVKMALNLYEDKVYSIKDIYDSVLIGLIRIYNCLTLDKFYEFLESYEIDIEKNELQDYIANNFKLANKISVVKYKKTWYVVSLEFNYYKDILNIRNDDAPFINYSLEEVLSVGKYKINLFNENILTFLSFLEIHLDPLFVDDIIIDLIIYSGFLINDKEVLYKISGNIDELYKEVQKVITYFPIWLYNGASLNFILQNKKFNKNKLCYCGSGKKYKNCCGKYV